MREEARKRRARSRARRRRKRPRREIEETPERVRVGLPRNTSSATVLLAIGGGAAAVALVMAAMASVHWLVPAGVALTLGTFLFAEIEPSIVEVMGVPEASTITLVLRDHAEVVLPRSAVERARVTTHQSSSGNGSSSMSYGVALQKADAGTLTLCKVGSRRDRAEAVVEEIDALVEAVAPDEAAEEELTTAAVRRLDDSERVTVERVAGSAGYREEASGALVVSWSLAPRPRSVFILPCFLGGMVTVVLGITAPAMALTYAALVFGAVLVVSVVLHVRKRAMRQVVTVDDERMTLAKERGGESVEEKRFPLDAVNAVDVAWTGPLMLRVDEANEEIQHLTEQVDFEGGVGLLDLPQLLRGVLAIARQSITIDTGALRLEERLDLESVLGAEVAERTGRTAGVV